MAWQQLINDKKKIYRFTEKYIDTIPLERGELIAYGAIHPLDWNKIEDIVTYLYKVLDNKKFKIIHIDCIKEKFGQIRIYSSISPRIEKKKVYSYDEEYKKYKQILKTAFKKYPGLNDYLSPDRCDEKILFTGTEADYKKRIKVIKNIDLNI